MTTSIKDLPPPYPNQALARSKEISEVRPQKVVREKAEEAKETIERAAKASANEGANGPSDGGASQNGGGRTLNLFA